MRRLAPLLALLAFGAAVAADTTGSRRDAEELKRKVAGISAFGQGTSRQTRRVAVSEQEVNAYLTYEAGQQLPVGVVDPSVTIIGTGRISGRAIVDLDAVRKERNPTSLFDPAFYLAGRVPVTATGVLRASQGVGRFQLESAAVAGVSIPKSVLQDIVSYYSRTPDNPAGLGLEDPFPLPARIREIQVEPGRAIIVQ